MRRLASTLLLAVLLTISCEFAAFVWLHYVAKAGWHPRYVPSPAAYAAPWLTENEPWGAWHVANTESRHEGKCYSVALRSNSAGARDRERAVDGDPHRTIVLGDSMTEGFGVEAGERVSDRLEARLGREFLNFGVTNDFGPLQEQILYQQLASRYAHDQVLILFLPDNDFTDNDRDYWQLYRPDYGRRYRPYYQAAASGGYVPYYPVARPGEGQAGPAAGGLLAGIGAVVEDNSWALAAYRHVRVMRSRPARYSGYFNFTDDELRAVLWSFAQIKELAGGRDVTIVMIPRRGDFGRVAAAGENPLGGIMQRFGAEHGIEVVDLLPLMPAIEPAIERYFLPCDGHWSPRGNAIAAEALAAALRLPTR